MQGQVLNGQATLAGMLIPAMHSTLHHFLSISVDPESDKPALVLAAEQDPAILLAILAADPHGAAQLTTWHDQFEASMLQAIAIAMSNAAVTHPAHADDVDAVGRQSLAHSLLADALARYVRGADATESRLIALLSGIGRWLRPSAEAVAADAVAADYLSALGCSADVCDAVRYCREPMEQLRGMPLAIRINAMVARLGGYIGGTGIVPAQVLAGCRSLAGLEESEIYDSLDRAARSLELALSEPAEGPAVNQAPRSCLAELAANASTGAVFYRAMVKAGEVRPWRYLVDQVGRFLFGRIGSCHFESASDGVIAAEMDGGRIEIEENRPNSRIAHCWREQRMTVVTRLRATDIVEKQLLRRLGADHLLLLPLADAGVLVCGIEQSFAENIDRHTVLLSAYAEAAADLHGRSPGQDTAVLSLDEVSRRAREITHEVNNPLAIVQNYLRTLSLKLGDEAPGQREIDAISREISRVGSIVQRYARIGRTEQLVYRLLDLNELVEDLLAVVSGGRDGLDVEKHFDPMIPPMELPADTIRQVVLNLLKNAVEALQDTQQPRITVSTQGAVNVGGKHYIEIVVSDNGPGMSHEQRLELFNGTTSTKGEGRGLGLAIVAQLVESMSAIITCRENNSVPGESGTSFQLLLPLEQE